MSKKNLMSKIWTVIFVCYVGWAVNVGMPVFEDTTDVYNNWIEDRNGQ